MKKKILDYKFLLIVCILVGAFLRLYQLNTIPGSLNQDEAAIGYNAYALLHTGADEHGKVFPLSLQSFGDWKLPVYPVFTIPFIVIFGLNETAVRLPSSLAGIIGIYLIFKIVQLLFKNNSIAVLAALFFAISPWSIYFSRAAYEVNLATTFFLASLYLFYRYINEKHKNSLLLIPASILAGLTLFTYHSFILFIPLYIIVTIIIFRKAFILNKWVIVSGLIFLCFIAASIISLENNGSNKVSNLSILNDPNVIYNRADKLKSDDAKENSVLKKLLHNKYASVVYQLGQNYVGVFSPEFLFDKGGEKLQHNLGYFGNFYLFDALLLLCGLVSLFWYREKAIVYLLPWFIIGPIPSALTKDTPNSTRLFLLLPLAIIVIAYGGSKIIDFIRKNTRYYKFLIGGVIILFAINVLYFLDGYFVHFNAERMVFWRYGNKQAVMLAEKYPNDTIVVRGPEDFRYIYFLFYEKYDPNTFRSQVQYYPMTSEGFLYVKSYGRYRFVNEIDYNHLQAHTIYIDDHGANNAPHTINLPSGEPVLGYTVSDEKKK